MKGQKKQHWVEEGYQVVSEIGFGSLKVESIARNIKKNKSSFYHYFGDLELFEQALLDHHLRMAEKFAIEAKQCKNIVPDMVDLFIKHKTDIFFHKQLRINRTKPQHKKCFELVFDLYEQAILDTWTNFLGLRGQSMLAKKILNLISENFLLQITNDRFTKEWLKNYLKDISSLMVQMNS